MDPTAFRHSPVVPIATPFDLTDYPELAGISAISGTGLVTRTAVGVYATRTITGTTNQINVADGNGVSGNPTISLPQNIHTGASPTFAGITLSGMTAGSVLFAGTSGVVSQDNSNLYWNDSSNYLGIGTNSPNNPLEIVQGDLNGSQLRLTNTRSGGNRFVIGVGDTGSTGSIVQPAGLFVYDIAASLTRFAIKANGYVGVGTSNPVLPFSVRASISSNEVASWQNTDTSGYSGSRMYDSSGNQTAAIGYGNSTVSNVGLQGKAYWYTATGVDLAFINNTTVNATLKSSGNLLIGTTTETASSGLIQLATGTTAAYGILAGTDTNLYRSAANRWTTDDSLSAAVSLLTPLLDRVSAGTLTIGGTAKTVSILASDTTTHTVNVGGTAGGAVTTDASSTQTVNINTSRPGTSGVIRTNINYAGVYGDILCTIDGGLLVNSSGTATRGHAFNETYAGGLELVSAQSYGWRAQLIFRSAFEGGTIYGKLGFNDPGSPAYTVWNSQNGILQFGTNNLERGRFDASGNLLIGTITTTASAGHIQLGGTGAANGIVFGTDTNLYRSAANTLKTDDALTIADTTASTSSTTGALIVSGGVGIAKALYVASDLVVTPTASATRWVTITGSNGGNPTISTSAGSLAITPAIVCASTLSALAITGNSFIPNAATVPTNGMYLEAANNPAFAANSTKIFEYDSTGIQISGTITTTGGATFHTTSTALTNGAGVAAGTLTNAPVAGDPTKWIGINDNGTTRYIPAW